MRKIFLIFTTVLIAGFTTITWAETSKEETRIEKDASAINKDGNTGENAKVVVQHLERQFKVDETRITSLRDKKLGYGEIAVVLAMADKLGGINDANIDKIMAMRQGPPKEGWGKIAKQLGFKLGPVISNVEKVKSEAHKDIEKAEREKGKVEKHEKAKKQEKAEKLEKVEKTEKPEKIERPAKPERPEKPERRDR